LEDVARVAGVSRATASRAINQDRSVGSTVRAQVTAAAVELGYVPNAAARALANSREEDCLALVVMATSQDFDEDPYYGRVLAGVVEATQRVDARVSVQLTDADGLARVPALAEPRRFAATVLVAVPIEVAARAPLSDLRHTVSIGRSADHVTSVDPDARVGGRTAVRHLLAKGRRRIGMIAGPTSNPCATERLDGYLEMMAESGLRATVIGADFTLRGAAEATRELLAREPDLDALFVASDLMAAATLQVLTARGVRVPDDIAIVGFDNSLPSRCTAPPLTTVAQPVERIAAWAATTSLSGSSARGLARIFPTELVVRASSG
jgi:DNA-binding LacI/PurR family transcriptional regulator